MQPAGIRKTSYTTDNAVVHTRTQWAMLIGFLILLFTAPLFLSGHTMGIISMIGIFTIGVLGLNILTGLCGQISLGQAAFMGVGAYTTAIMMGRFGISFWVALPCAGIASGIVGLIFGLPSLRCKGFYLAMSTLAAQFILFWIFMHGGSWTGRFDGTGVPAPTLGGITFKTNVSVYFLIMTITVIMTFFARNITRSRAGRAFVAVRDNDLAAEVMGIDIFRYKLIAFFICSFYAGIAGSLYGVYVGWISPDHFTLMDSIWMLAMLIVGGMGSTVGTIAGVVFLRAIRELAAMGGDVLAAAYPSLATFALGVGTSLVFGLIVVLFLIFEPRGLNHRWELFKAWYRLLPFPY
jgi:branched-chain amino acid transport system permease protein